MAIDDKQINDTLKQVFLLDDNIVRVTAIIGYNDGSIESRLRTRTGKIGLSDMPQFAHDALGSLYQRLLGLEDLCAGLRSEAEAVSKQITALRGKTETHEQDCDETENHRYGSIAESNADVNVHMKTKTCAEAFALLAPKTGEKFKVVETAESHERDWPDTWEDEMDDFLELICVAKEIDAENYGVYLAHPHKDCSYYFPAFVLERVDE